MDKIIIQNLQCQAIIGCNPPERITPQPLTISAVLDCDLTAPCKSDDLNDTVNYGEIARAITKLAENSSFFLIERFAEECASICLAFPKIQSATITVRKPNAIKNADCAAIEISRAK